MIIDPVWANLQSDMENLGLCPGGSGFVSRPSGALGRIRDGPESNISLLKRFEALNQKREYCHSMKTDGIRKSTGNGPGARLIESIVKYVYSSALDGMVWINGFIGADAEVPCNDTFDTQGAGTRNERLS